MDYTREFANLINTAYYLHEGADICLREFERQLIKQFGKRVRFKTKKRYNEILQATRQLEFLVEDFLSEYNECYTRETIGERTENIRQIASYFARLCLLIGDRCDLGDGSKEQQIWDFVKSMPTTGAITDNTLDKLKL